MAVKRTGALLVGVTGGIATGKSTVTRMLVERGAVAFSADEASRAVLNKNGPVLRQVVAAFGAGILTEDGSLDREALASSIFSNPDSRTTLNGIMHPHIRRLLRDQIESAQADFLYPVPIVVEIPLLYEGGLEKWFELVVVVTASETVQIQRLMQRTHISESAARARIASQMPLVQKEARAGYVVVNDGSLHDLTPQVDRLWEHLVNYET